VIFEWDPKKAKSNCRKHRVSFEESATVFNDILSITYSDPDHSASEERFLTVGMSAASRLLVIAHTDHGERIRIISARAATQKERKQYEEEN